MACALTGRCCQCVGSNTHGASSKNAPELVNHSSHHIVPPLARTQVEGLVPLREYIDRVSAQLFAAPAPHRGDAAHDSGAAGPSWSDAAQGARKPPRPSTLTPAEREFRRNSLLWLAGAGAVVAAYIVFSGRYFNVRGVLACFVSLDAGAAHAVHTWHILHSKQLHARSHWYCSAARACQVVSYPCAMRIACLWLSHAETLAAYRKHRATLCRRRHHCRARAAGGPGPHAGPGWRRG